MSDNKIISDIERGLYYKNCIYFFLFLSVPCFICGKDCSKSVPPDIYEVSYIETFLLFWFTIKKRCNLRFYHCVSLPLSVLQLVS